MRSVRCDNCGKKALIAASKCPQCGHLFDLRDSFGELLPMAHCSSCDSDYPARRGSCRWCGTKAAAPRARSFARSGVALVVLFGLTAGGWVAWQRLGAGPRELSAEPPVPATPVAVHEAAPTPLPDSAPSLSAPDDSTVADSVAVDTGGVAAGIDSVATAPTRTASVAAGDVGGALLPVAAVPKRRVDPVLTPGAVVSPRRDRPSQGMPRRSSVTVRSLAAVTQAWTPVRASADPDAPIVGTVGPETRVQLGESRGEWVRLSSGAISGWAERRQFVVR